MSFNIKGVHVLNWVYTHHWPTTCTIQPEIPPNRPHYIT